MELLRRAIPWSGRRASQSSVRLSWSCSGPHCRAKQADGISVDAGTAASRVLPSSVSRMRFLLATVFVGSLRPRAGDRRALGLCRVLWRPCARRPGGTYSILKTDDPRLSPSMRLALGDPPPARAGRFEWREIDIEVAELPVIAGAAEVDRIMLAQMKIHDFASRFATARRATRISTSGWRRSGAALVINGSYYSRYGAPDTPLVSAGALLGPRDYDAKARRLRGLSDLCRDPRISGMKTGTRHSAAPTTPWCPTAARRRARPTTP